MGNSEKKIKKEFDLGGKMNNVTSV